MKAYIIEINKVDTNGYPNGHEVAAVVTTEAEAIAKVAEVKAEIKTHATWWFFTATNGGEPWVTYKVVA